MTITEKAPGKLILIGEYAVLEGAPALVLAVNRYAYATLKKRDDQQFSISAPSIQIEDVPFSLNSNNCIVFPARVKSATQKRLTFFKTTFEYAWHYLRSCGCDLSACDIVIDTEAFYSAEVQSKLGFGSSAALTVALVRALFHMVGRDLQKEEVRDKLFRLSLFAHRRAQGNMGSGIDIAASAYGGALEYLVGINRRAEQQLPYRLDVWPELPMLVLFSGKSESTRRMVSGVKQLQSEQPGLYDELMRNLGSCSRVGCEAYARRDIDLFLKNIAAFYNFLDELGRKSAMPIISDVHRNLAEMAGQHGAVYKPSGAGSGDIGVAFANDENNLLELKNAAAQKGITAVDVNVAPPC